LASGLLVLSGRETPVEIAFLHTAEAHVQTFDVLLDQLGFRGKRTHRVMPELLQRARSHGLESARGDISEALAEIATADAVMCTCSTIGSVADDLSRTHPHVFRIDRPAMEEACKNGPDVMLAACLESTVGPSLGLLVQCAKDLQIEVSPRIVLCDAAWPHFEAGDQDAFARAIAEAIGVNVAQKPPDCIMLAQASMRVAEVHLRGWNVPVISSPSRAAARAVEIATNHRSSIR
jgi:hypothetical protein